VSRFRGSNRREVPGINTASLPDMIFTLLFFFMIVTHIQTVPSRIPMELPTAEELQKLEERSLIVYVRMGVDTPIQLNSDFVEPADLPEQLEILKSKTAEEDRGRWIAVLKIDREVPMGRVNDLKQALRSAGILTIHYSAAKTRTK
jgi:biopolymer transport protein ExbD